MIVFDIESNGLLDTVSKVHCINAIDRATGREYRFTDHAVYQDAYTGEPTDIPTPRNGTIADALKFIGTADTIGGHFIIGYDLQALAIVYPGFAPTGKARDSKLMSEIIYPDLKDKDFARIRKGLMPEGFAKLAGRHTLQSWGLRLGGEQKADFNPEHYGHTWATAPFSQDMDDYCMQDVRTNVGIFEHFESKEYAEQCLDIEHEFFRIMQWQEATGVPFNVKDAERLTADLQIKRVELEAAAQATFGTFYMQNGTKTFTPKRDNWKQGYVGGCPLSKIKPVVFNPGSRMQIANRLTAVHGWSPTEFTPKGQPKVDETVLGTLPYPEAKVIAEYMLVAKRLSQIAEGEEAWLRAVKPDGRIYGRVNTLGTITGRCSHSGPNLGQVPNGGAPYGPECRALFTAEPGRVLVGCDADALELRVLAHFMARFDGGEYTNTVLNGNKEDGTDMHSRNQRAINLVLRDTAKTWFYAFIYGAGNLKLGHIIMGEWDEKKLNRFYQQYPAGKSRDSAIVRLGRQSREKFMKSLPALKKLTEAVKTSAKRGWLKGLDGRQITVRSAHAALNTLLQSGGAVIMKLACNLMFAEFAKRGLDVRPLLNIHDEVQLSTTKEDADEVGKIAASAIKWAGEYFNFRCPLDGDYAVGHTWAETH